MMHVLMHITTASVNSVPCSVRVFRRRTTWISSLSRLWRAVILNPHPRPLGRMRGKPSQPPQVRESNARCNASTAVVLCDPYRVPLTHAHLQRTTSTFVNFLSPSSPSSLVHYRERNFNLLTTCSHATTSTFSAHCRVRAATVRRRSSGGGRARPRVQRLGEKTGRGRGAQQNGKRA